MSRGAAETFLEDNVRWLGTVHYAAFPVRVCQNRFECTRDQIRQSGPTANSLFVPKLAGSLFEFKLGIIDSDESGTDGDPNKFRVGLGTQLGLYPVVVVTDGLRTETE